MNNFDDLFEQQPPKDTVSRKAEPQTEKPSVRQELRDIQAQRKKEAEAPRHEEPVASRKKAAQKTTRHQQPKPKKKPKSKER